MGEWDKTVHHMAILHVPYVGGGGGVPLTFLMGSCTKLLIYPIKKIARPVGVGRVMHELYLLSMKLLL